MSHSNLLLNKAMLSSAVVDGVQKGGGGGGGGGCCREIFEKSTCLTLHIYQLI